MTGIETLSASAARSPGEAPVIGVIMGSQSDWVTMQHAATVLEALEAPFETRIVSAHRTPKRLYEYATQARSRGLKVIIAGAGGAAHLPGMVAALTSLPVFGVPVESHALKGMDSLMSIVQMPGGIPVGTLAIGKAGAINAALLAAAVLALMDPALAVRLEEWRRRQTESVAMIPVSETSALVGGA
ncbi:N(5)-carboxyaminoimidazole ribonucleotide mutase [Azospirillaceae bacterium]